MAEIALEFQAKQFGLTAPWDAYPWFWDTAFEAVETPGIWDREGNPKPAYFVLEAMGIL